MREAKVTAGDVLFCSAARLAEAIARREVTSREVTEGLLGRIDAVDPDVNAVIEVRAEDALRAAADADAVLAGGGPVGDLHGIPMTVKDAFHVAGLHTTWGDPGAREFVAAKDATVVRRLRDAGAIVVGKTNVAFMLADFAQTVNELHGTTNNPWDLGRTAGGSSGGSAAALAAGLTFLEYGSDLVGSIRIPAGFCGVYGLKPSVGVVPLTGFAPPGPLPADSEWTYMSAVGPLARSAADLRTALRVTAGPENAAGRAYRWALPASRHARLADFRVGAVLDDPHAPVTGDVGAVLSDTLDALATTGATIVQGWPEGLDPGRSAESFGVHVELFFAFQPAGGESRMPLSAVVEHERRRMAARAAWSAHFDDVDVFLCPTNFTAAFPHDPRPFEQRTIGTTAGDRPYTDQPFWISHASLAGLPALSAPVGRTSTGLPVGLQVIGPLFEDDTAITFAELLAEVSGGFHPPALSARS